MHSNIIICGDIQVGKSTLVNALIDKIQKPVSGFITKSLNDNGCGYHEIFMYSPKDPSNRRLLAICEGEKVEVYSNVFDTFGCELLSQISSDDIVVMDEIGFMEEKSEKFKNKVLEILDGNIPVIAAVKSGHPDSEFLNSVRNSKNALLYFITKENRDNLLNKIVKEQLS